LVRGAVKRGEFDMQTPVQWGSEFVVNATTSGAQASPAIAALDDGRFVVTWSDGSHALGDTLGAISAQIFNADGTPYGAEFVVKPTTTGDHGLAVIAALNGGFVVAWTDDSATGGDLSAGAIRAQIYDAAGAPVAGQLLLNTVTTGDQTLPQIAALSDGRFVASWSDNSQLFGDTDDYAVVAQIFNGDGTLFGGEFLVNTSTAGDQASGALCGLNDGGFVVSWYDYGQTAIEAQVFDPTGAPVGGEFTVNTTPLADASLPKIATLADGRFVATWSDSSTVPSAGDDFDVRGQIFSPDGSKSGGEFVVNTTTTDIQWKPDIAALPDGGFIVTWTDGSVLSWDQYAQVFNADGTKSGDPFELATGLFDDAGGSPAALADGRMVIAWSHNTGTLFGGDLEFDVHARLFDGRTDPVTLFGTGFDDSLVGTFLGDTIEGRAGDDELWGENGQDTLRGEGGADVLHGGFGNDLLDGGNGSDDLHGDSGGDTLIGGPGDDNLDGGAGDDDMAGGLGNDTYVLSSTFDVVTENPGEGTDTVMTGAFNLYLGHYANVENGTLTGDGNLELKGSGADNRLVGNGGSNVIKGFKGEDLLKGHAGTDTLVGGKHKDALVGGAGADTFVFLALSDSTSAAAGRDTIRDFNPGEGDMIDLSGIDAIAGGADDAFTYVGSAAFSNVAGELRYAVKNGNAILEGDVNGDGIADFAVKARGVTDFVASDFVL
jgi:RTX calcium-binding nonapeptide repeat (4 copies)